MRYDVAPLEGITTYLFRQTHAELFGGADRYFTPFFSPAAEHLLTARELRDLTPEHNQGIRVIPQVMTRKAADFLWAAEKMAEFGYPEINLNLGCPSGTVTAKGKGSGFLARPEELDQFFAAIFEKTPILVSVKTRLGVQSAEEFPALLEIYNRYPIKELIIHVRVQKAFYKGPVQRDAFAYAQTHTALPVCYNGDLTTVAEVETFRTEFPSAEAVMLGRGVAADPALLRKIHGGPAASREELQIFTRTLYERYRASYQQDRPAAQRMKELWFYLIHLFDGGDKLGREMRRVSHPRQYERLEEEIFRDLPLRREPQGPLT